jgi:hypothetical protein
MVLLAAPRPSSAHRPARCLPERRLTSVILSGRLRNRNLARVSTKSSLWWPGRLQCSNRTVLTSPWWSRTDSSPRRGRGVGLLGGPYTPTVLAGWPAVSRSDGVAGLSDDGCVQLCYIVCMAIGLWWDHPSGVYVRTRSSRYPGATDIEPAWPLEAAADPRRITRDPDPKSHRGDIRVVGYSPAAGFVTT